MGTLIGIGSVTSVVRVVFVELDKVLTDELDTNAITKKDED